MLMFLKSVGEALVAKGLGALKGFVPFGSVIYDVGADAIDRYRKARKEAQLAADAEALLKAELKQVRDEAERIVREVAKGESEEIIELAVAYLTQMPGTIRQSLKRADDPSGTTIPATLNLVDPVQLSAVLPRRLPIFRAGDAVPHAPQWKFVELLGAGGFGEVWLAKHAYLDDLRAIKFCLDAASRNRLLTHEKDVVRRVMKASAAVSDSDHGIVRLLDCYLEPDGPWLAYEYIDGGDLAAWARANALLAPPARAVNALNMVRDLAGVVGHFHALPQPVIHRDLKPANVLLKKVNGRWLLRVTDFGISHVGATAGLARATVSTPSMSLGDTFRGAHTPTYASPQQKRGEPADPRDDVHALGIIALQLLLGDLTAERPSGNSWRKKLAGCELPVEVLDLLARCWEDDPDERPRDAREVLAALAPLSPGGRGVGGEGGRENPAPATEPPVIPLVKALPPTPPARKAGDQTTILLPGKVPMTFAWCPPGTFMMGSPDGEVRGGGFDELLHVVTLTKGFWIGIYPITQAQWRVVADTDPSHFKGDTLPVEQVSWDDTQAFCAALKQKAGIELRLPTEAEWEYAARGGTTTPYYWGDELNGTQANCGGFSPYGTKRAGPSVEKPTRVGNYAESFPHPWGLADVIGNVCEWCADWYGSYPTGVAVDPTGPNTGSRRVCRGGRWWDSAKHCRAASRDKNPPDNSDNGIGFRLAADAASLG